MRTTESARPALRIPPKLQPWFQARQRLGLSHATVQMARELGLNPAKLGKLVPPVTDRWKLPLPEFVADCYRKRFGRSQPEQVVTLEQLVQDQAHRKEVRRRERAAKKAAAPPSAAE
jgi:hypothetical protein